MSINDIIIYIMVVFMAVGVIDKILGNKFGFGEKFEEGIMAMGTLTLSMVGIISLAPVLAKLLNPVVVPLYKVLGADPAMFAGTLLACDMGGYPLAQQLAEDPALIPFAGLILGSMMGATIVFTIPVGLGIIQKDDQKFLAKGVLAGIITIPIGSFVGGLLTGLSAIIVFKNLIPIIIVAVLIALGLKFIPSKMITGFIYFGRFVTAMSLVGLASIIIETLTGVVIIPGLAPLSDGVSVVGAIAIVLAGAYPLVHFITKVFKNPLMKVGSLLGMGEVAAAGMVATLANNIPMFGMLKDMDDRGKVINVAFSVSAAFVFGDHLGFVAGVDKNTITAMIVGKLVAGITAVAVACLITTKSKTLNK
ncbi:MAG: ethanolamine utilization protein EutH [Sedimentibacter sp.]